jgi:hypothetical protein
LQRFRPIALSIVLLIVTIIIGLAIRFVSLGLPPVIVKYGGSMLWALNDLLDRLGSAAVVTFTCRGHDHSCCDDCRRVLQIAPLTGT